VTASAIDSAMRARGWRKRRLSRKHLGGFRESDI
jgi:hypothetical protein